MSTPSKSSQQHKICKMVLQRFFFLKKKKNKSVTHHHPHGRSRPTSFQVAVACARTPPAENAQTLFLSQDKNASPRITDRTNYTKTASRACTKTRAHKTRTEETEQTVPQHTHMCVELCTQSLEGSEDSLSLLPALLPGCPVCPQSCLCVMAKGIGHLPCKARHKQLTVEGSTPPLGPVAALDWDDSYSSKTEQPCTASYIGVLRQHIRHIVAAWDLPQCDSAIFHQSLEPQIFDIQMTHTSQPSGRCERFGRRRICC